MMCEEGDNLEQKPRFPNSVGLAVDQIVFSWFCKVKNKNMSISGSLLKQKALQKVI